MLSMANWTMSISRLFFCTGVKLVCSTYYHHHHHHHHSRFSSHDHYHQLNYGYVSTLLTPPKGGSSK